MGLLFPKDFSLLITFLVYGGEVSSPEKVFRQVCNWELADEDPDGIFEEQSINILLGHVDIKTTQEYLTAWPYTETSSSIWR